MTHHTPGFTGAIIDRADALRQDPARLAELARSPAALQLRLDGLMPTVEVDGSLAWDPLVATPYGDEDLIFLGLGERAAPLFVAVPPPDVAIDGFSRAVLRLLPLMARDQMALYGAARSLVDWHARHRFCARCGAPTHGAKGGWQRNCAACGAQHFPRTDPVVIMLAEHEGEVLVGRQSLWPAGMMSALAGFVEPGESIEEAVARELYEEAGVRVDGVRYIASQPWPFPSSLMIGCIARTQDRTITLDQIELESALWVNRTEVAAALAGEMHAPFVAPQPLAIANTLLRAWVAGE